MTSNLPPTYKNSRVPGSKLDKHLKKNSLYQNALKYEKVSSSRPNSAKPREATRTPSPATNFASQIKSIEGSTSSMLKKFTGLGVRLNSFSSASRITNLRLIEGKCNGTLADISNRKFTSSSKKPPEKPKLYPRKSLVLSRASSCFSTRKHL